MVAEPRPLVAQTAAPDSSPTLTPGLIRPGFGSAPSSALTAALPAQRSRCSCGRRVLYGLLGGMAGGALGFMHRAITSGSSSFHSGPAWGQAFSARSADAEFARAPVGRYACDVRRTQPRRHLRLTSCAEPVVFLPGASDDEFQRAPCYVDASSNRGPNRGGLMRSKMCLLLCLGVATLGACSSSLGPVATLALSRPPDFTATVARIGVEGGNGPDGAYSQVDAWLVIPPSRAANAGLVIAKTTPVFVRTHGAVFSNT